jgi:hypothetical protein
MTDFRQRYVRVKVAERLAKDDIAIVDLQDAIVKHSHVGYSTEADIQNRVRDEVMTAVKNAETPTPPKPPSPLAPRTTATAQAAPPIPPEQSKHMGFITPPAIIDNKLTDRGVLLIAYGALKVSRDEGKRAVAEIIRAHLYPHHDPSHK